MDDVDVSKWIADSGFNKRAVSRRSGVARTTVDRIIRDVRPAKWDTLEEVAAACGVELDVVASPLSEPLALEAVRVRLEPSYEPSDVEGVEAWTARLQRWQEDPADERELERLAAWAANPAARKGLRKFSANHFEALVEGARRSGADWALSGSAPSRGEAVGGKSAPVILWAADADAVAEGAEVPESEDGSVWLLPSPLSLFQNSYEVDGLRYVSKAQARLDAQSLEARA